MMPHTWLGNRSRAERIFLILFPIMCCVFVYVIVHRDRVHSDSRIATSQARSIKIANQKILAVQYKACLRGTNLRKAVNDAHTEIRFFMDQAIASAERRAKLETGAKHDSDLKAITGYKKARSKFHNVPQVNCAEVIYGRNKPPLSALRT